LNHLEDGYINNNLFILYFYLASTRLCTNTYNKNNW